MSTEALHHIAAADAARARRVTELWSQPVLSDVEIPIAAKLPPSLWAECKKLGDTPPLYTVGRRLFVRTEDLRKWIDAKAAAGRPGSKRLRAAKAEPEAA